MEKKLNYQLINKLDQDVINKICAGEVIHRPFNVVKELIENSLDSGASNITVTLKNGGIKQIIIQDNGCGINKEDLKIVCERFTTSKLETLEDFSSLTTFGFRGEALSSISIVSQVTIISKTADSICAYKAEYVDGHLKDGNSIIPIAANDGTQIIVDNLFYNMPIRKATLLSETQELNLVQNLIRKYSLIFSGKCGFILKKHNENNHLINTNVSNTLLNNIDILFRKNISSYLLPIDFENEKFGYKINGYFSNNDLNLEQFHFILSINSRLVECGSLKKALKELYKDFLMKGGHPFVFISIEINPKNIDVNIHPTKNEVFFLYDQEIIKSIIEFIENKLKNKPDKNIEFNSSSAELSFEFRKDLNPNILNSTLKSEIISPTSTDLPKLIQNDRPSKSSNLHQTSFEDFLNVFNNEKGQKVDDTKKKQVTNNNNKIDKPIFKKTATTLPPQKFVRVDSKLQRLDQYLNQRTFPSKQRRRSLELTSLSNLKEKLNDNTDQNLLNIVSESTYVGCVDQNFLLIQHQLNLFMIKIKNFNQELFYEIFLLNFGNFDYLRFKEPLSIRTLLSTYLEVISPEIDVKIRNEKIDEMTLFILKKQELLDDYFSIKINKTNETIEAMPILIENHQPEFVYLPEFIYKLISNVSWNDEESCFHSLGLVLADFYSNTYICDDDNDDNQKTTWSNLIENTIYPLYKNLLLPSNQLKNDSFFLITNIDNLYKVFERC